MIWNLADIPLGSFTQKAIVDRDGICVISGSYEGLCDSDDSGANLLIAAAAMDLLEACELHIGALRSRIRDGNYSAEYADGIYLAQNKMIAAIAKARGEA